MKQPQILTLNVPKDVVDYLKEKDLNIDEGSIGKLITLNLSSARSARCLLQNDYPDNFHEYEVLIIDLTNEESVDYNPAEHTRKYNKTTKDSYFLCEHPQTIFDPRAITLHLLSEKIKHGLSNNLLLILFCAADEEIEYKLISEANDEYYEYTLYSFLEEYIPSHFNKHGMQTQVKNDKNELYHFLKKYNSEMSYDMIFSHPYIYENNKYIKNPDFYPLVLNKAEEIVSWCLFPSDKAGIFLFPHVKDKRKFLSEFLREIAPSILPAIFPENIKNKWVQSPAYSLPNHEKLVEERTALQAEFDKKLAEKDEEIATNSEGYAFLHDLLTKTDAELVNAVIKYLEWLGFTHVNDGDKINEGGLKEEDIQIETEKGLLIFEVKGLGATSKDSDCNQIGKIKYRRARQRNKFDVYANYIVNHQRHMPPLDRKNPPFTPQQMEDAQNEERGLLTTWQLFNLYFSVERGVLTKEDIKESFYNYGLIDFIPKSYVYIGAPRELYDHDTIVVILLPADVTLTLDDELLIVGKNMHDRVHIQSIRVADHDVNSATGTETGLKLSGPVHKNERIYKIV